ncbi:long-chain fatty acid transport protein [Methylovorus glucosotrophus]|uniref:OmpP1/FadL family transporter n=1 Tax=Methylovorus glucosotrophus TaxID=266009 RepID=UPI001331BFFF|nr:outer membrane protein transport protein [Methylovorus glucosotrophus]KAF0844182.1 long-chain fatty acid transport protein [Methylovorus glucosotrophus]
MRNNQVTMGLLFRTLSVVAIPILLPSAAHGAGFSLIEQSVSAMGNAYAGAAAGAEDATTVYFNPAGMVYLPQSQLVVGAHAIRPSGHFNNEGSVSALGRPGTGEGGDLGSWAVVPNFYYSHVVTPDIRIGIAVNAPFGLKTEYDKDWIGRFQAVKSELKTYNINPAVAFRVNDRLSLGLGVSVMYADAELTRAVNLVTSESTANISGDDWGYGFNLGAIYQPASDTRIGLTYRSRVVQHLEGTVKFGQALAANNGKISANLDLPESLSLSAVHHVNEQWELLGDISWTRWSQFNELRILNSNGTVLSLTPENWRNTMRYSIGVSYRYNPQWKLRAGLAYDEEAMNERDRTTRIPGNDRLWLTLGAGWAFSEKDRLDVGYAHLFLRDARIDDNQSSASAGFNGRITGSYDSDVNIVSVQWSRRF